MFVSLLHDLTRQYATQCTAMAVWCMYELDLLTR